MAIKNSKEVEFLGIKLDRNMNFHTHIKNICRKAGQKLSAVKNQSLRRSKKKSFIIQVNDKISVQLLSISLDALFKAIK